MAQDRFVKIAFYVEQDDDGYPPHAWETLWARPVDEGGLYQIDIPLWVKGLSSEDVVHAEEQDGRLQFVRLVRPSANSVFRVYLSDESDVQSARASFRALVCESEQSYIPKLPAMEIPGSTVIEPVERLLEEGAASGRWEYEEGVLRHGANEFPPLSVYFLQKRTVPSEGYTRRVLHPSETIFYLSRTAQKPRIVHYFSNRSSLRIAHHLLTGRKISTMRTLASYDINGVPANVFQAGDPL